MSPNEELYPGSDFESDMTDKDMAETDTTTTETNQDTFGEQIIPDETDMEKDSDSDSDSDQIGTETPLDQLRDDKNY